MNSDGEIKQLLTEIRDNQILALQRQQEQLDLSRQQVEREKTQIAESIELQKLAMAQFKSISIIAIPGILLCIGLILYLVIRYL